jgi:predicted transcriptional regulator
MPPPKNNPVLLARREREIMNAVFALGNRAPADEIRARLTSPPSESVVRVMMRIPSFRDFPFRRQRDQVAPPSPVSQPGERGDCNHLKRNNVACRFGLKLTQRFRARRNYRADLGTMIFFVGIRIMIARLEKKGFLKHQQDGARHLYSATISPAVAKRTALQQCLQTFFSGSLRHMVSALVAEESRTDEELGALKDEIERVRKERKKQS